MEKKNKLYHFESHDELRDYIKKGFPQEVYLTTLKSVAVRGDKVVTDVPSGCEVEPVSDKHQENGIVYPAKGLGVFSRPLGSIDDYPATDFAVDRDLVAIDIEADTMLNGLYQAGDELTARVTAHSIDHCKVFTAKEMSKGIVNLSISFAWPEGQEVLYRITTPTGKYQVAETSLWDVLERAEKAEGVGLAKRRRFTIHDVTEENRNVVARFTFDADKMLAPMKKCLDTSNLRPVMAQPALDVTSGVVVASDGRILVAHKLQGYKSEIIDRKNLLFDMVSLPREITQMKGVVTVEVMPTDRNYQSKTYDAQIVTATDSAGKHGEVRQQKNYPNWYSVIPSSFGKAINVDAKAWVKTLKPLIPQLDQSSLMMHVSAMRGAVCIEFRGDDPYYAQSGSVSVPVEGGVVSGIWVGLKAPLVMQALVFQPSRMHFINPSKPVVLFNDDTLVMVMPMMLEADAPSGYTPDNDEMEGFSASDWAGSSVSKCKDQEPAVKQKTKAEKPKVKVQVPTEKVEPAITQQPSLEERLRAALRKQLGMVA